MQLDPTGNGPGASRGRCRRMPALERTASRGTVHLFPYQPVDMVARSCDASYVVRMHLKMTG
jgi:hypothetical protein